MMEMFNRTKYYTNLSEQEQKSIFTEKQWRKKGYIPLSDAMGVELFPNKQCTQEEQLRIYFQQSEVREMTIEEKAAFKLHERELRQKYRENKAEKEREEFNRQISIVIENERAACQEASEIRVKEIQAYALKQHIEAYEKLMPASTEVIDCDTLSGTGDTIVVDTETTGLSLDGSDEILQLSIIDAASGSPLYNGYFHPIAHTSWDGAEKINHISPESLSDKPYFIEEKNKIQNLFFKAHKIIGYNTDFDIDFLSLYNISHSAEVIDVMREFAPVFGEKSEKHGGYKWQKLSTCYEYFKNRFPNDPLISEIKFHNILDDCIATLFCYRCLKRLEGKKHNEFDAP